MASNQIVHHKPGDSGLWMLAVIIACVVITPGFALIACFPGLLIIALWLIHDEYSTQKDKNRTPEERAKIREEDDRIYKQCRGLDPWEQEEAEKQDRKDQSKKWMETQKRIIGGHHGEY